MLRAHVFVGVQLREGDNEDPEGVDRRVSGHFLVGGPKVASVSSSATPASRSHWVYLVTKVLASR